MKWIRLIESVGMLRLDSRCGSGETVGSAPQTDYCPNFPSLFVPTLELGNLEPHVHVQQLEMEIWLICPTLREAVGVGQLWEDRARRAPLLELHSPILMAAGSLLFRGPARVRGATQPPYHGTRGGLDLSAQLFYVPALDSVVHESPLTTTILFSIICHSYPQLYEQPASAPSPPTHPNQFYIVRGPVLQFELHLPATIELEGPSHRQ